MRLASSTAILWVVGAVLIGVGGYSLSPYWLFLATSAVVGALVARSVGIVTGQAGMISLCQMTFAATAAWVVAELQYHHVAIPFLLQVLIGAAATIPLGLALGVPALRVRGINLAVVTLGFAFAANLYLNRSSFPGVDRGVAVTPEHWLAEPRRYFLFCWIAFCVVCGTLGLVARRRVGASWLAVRYSERAAAAMGMSVTRTKLGAFALSAFVAGLGGGLLAGLIGLLTPQSFDLLTSLVTFAVAVMVAAEFAAGALIAGCLPVFLLELLRRLGWPLDIGNFLFGVGVVDSLRRGKGGAAAAGHDAIARRRARSLRTTARIEPGPVNGSAPVGSKPSGKHVLEARGVTIRFGTVVALDGFELRLEPQTVTALIGPNGAGKSTFVDAVTGFLGYSGEILLDGTPVDRLSAGKRARLGIRRTFQQDRTIPDLTVGQYVRLAARRRLDERELREYLSYTGCPDPRVPLSAVDVGSRRLVEIAGVLSAGPKITLFDEPAAGLARSDSQLLAARIAEIPERFGATVLLIEHDMEHVQAASAAVTVLDFGRVIASGTPREVLASKAVAAAYLGEEMVLS